MSWFGHFGKSVSISGDTAIVGTTGNHQIASKKSGVALVFIRSGDEWVQEALLYPSTSDVDIDSEEFFGFSVCISGDRAIVGSCRSDINEISRAGSAYIFSRTDGVWRQDAHLFLSDYSYYDNFGISVSINEDNAFVGANGYGTGGAAFLYKLTNDQWILQSKIIPSDNADDDNFGQSVCLSDTGYFLVGAPGEAAPEPDSGAAYVYSPEAIQLEMLKGHLLTSSPVPDELLPDADVNGDGKLDVGDINTLLAQ